MHAVPSVVLRNTLWNSDCVTCLENADLTSENIPRNSYYYYPCAEYTNIIFKCKIFLGALVCLQMDFTFRKSNTEPAVVKTIIEPPLSSIYNSKTVFINTSSINAQNLFHRSYVQITALSYHYLHYLIYQRSTHRNKKYNHFYTRTPCSRMINQKQHLLLVLVIIFPQHSLRQET